MGQGRQDLAGDIDSGVEQESILRLLSMLFK